MIDIQPGAIVRIKGDPRGDAWRVVYVGYALGHHYREAHLRIARESMCKITRIEPVSTLEPFPPDLEDFPCSPV